MIVMVNTNQRGVLISTLYEVITLFFLKELFGSFFFFILFLSRVDGRNKSSPAAPCFPPLSYFPLNPFLFKLSRSLRFLSCGSATPAGVKKKKGSCYTLPSSGGWRNYSGEWACLLPPTLDDLTCGPINPRVIDEPFYSVHNSQLF